MVKVNEIYEIALPSGDWNSLVKQLHADITDGKETVIEREIGGQPVKCLITGYTYNNTKKPFQPQRQKIKVLITELVTREHELTKENN